jgi:hypothetical protein
MDVVGSALQHVMVVGGTPKDWEASSGSDEWVAMVDRLGRVAAAAGARWLTIRPYGPEPAGSESSSAEWFRYVSGDGPCTVILNPVADGRQAFVGAATAIPPDRTVDEQAIVGALYAPADVEADLIVICGPSDRLPPSLVWELAYGELVFVERELPWEVTARDLERAIETFHGRSRRFGGLDS